MIIKKRWFTKDWVVDKRGYYKGERRVIIREWEGLFLFGFIPLWLENIKTSYS